MKIALLGDIALIGRYDRTIRNDVDKRTEIVRQLTSDCDYVIGNLESPLTSITNTLTCKGVYLRSNPTNVNTLVQMGVTHVTLANNHIYDYGRKGAVETIKTLRAVGIRHVGLNNPPEILKKDSNRVMLDGFCCLSANAINYGSKSGQVKVLTPENMELFLRRAEEECCLPIASIHFGVEGLHYPSVEHLRLFRSMADKHEYVLHGNHPHALQGYEEFNNSLLIYAQGNLCFDVTPVTSIHFVPAETDEERKSYISVIETEGNKVKSYRMISVTDLDTYKIHENKSILSELDRYSEALKCPESEIQKMRNDESKKLRTSSQARNLRFYINRLNYKYIGAYLNGKRNRRLYLSIMREFLS